MKLVIVVSDRPNCPSKEDARKANTCPRRSETEYDDDCGLPIVSLVNFVKVPLLPTEKGSCPAKSEVTKVQSKLTVPETGMAIKKTVSAAEPLFEDAITIDVGAFVLVTYPSPGVALVVQLPTAKAPVKSLMTAACVA